MKVLAIGDVHGCYYTFRELVEKYWNPEKEILVQLGDLVNRGNHSLKCLAYAKKLKANHPDRVVFLKGNHEYDLLQYLKGKPNLKWLRGGGEELIQKIFESGTAYRDIADWVDHLPHSWENDVVFLSHAGKSKGYRTDLEENSPVGLLYNRQALIPIGKMQVIGHVPCKKGTPEYNKSSNSWRIDTAAYTGKALTGLKISKKGNIKQICQVQTDERDFKRQ